jgi:transcriptional regulator with PAS, ATPase and Fis domain
MDPISADEVLAVLPQSQPGLQLQHLSQCSLEDVERLHIQRVLEASGGNKTHAAKTLDIDYKTLLAKLKKYGL